jgi:hypothetical protein
MVMAVALVLDRWPTAFVVVVLAVYGMKEIPW